MIIVDIDTLIEKLNTIKLNYRNFDNEEKYGHTIDKVIETMFDSLEKPQELWELDIDVIVDSIDKIIQKLHVFQDMCVSLDPY